VAEGVESPQVAASLRAMGCDVAQGWQFSRPLNATAAAAWLARRNAAPVVAAGEPGPVRAAAATRPAPAPAAKPPPGSRPAPASAARPASAPTPPPGSRSASPAAPDPRAGDVPAAVAPAPVPDGDCLDAAARP
jgi:hypothetical protein